MTELVSLEQVRAAAELLKGVALETPVELSRVLSELAGGETFIKCENLQRTGAFKIRGAYNRIHKLSADERDRGVVAASAGNHAQGVALAASLLGVKSTVFMPQGAALPKVEATQRYGAQIVLGGAVYDDAYAAAERFASESRAVMVHPFDHPDVIAGQGTIAVEIFDKLPQTAAIVVPVGGGGLISGIAAAAKQLRPDVQVIGVEPTGAANVSRALAEGHVVELAELTTVADGLAAKRTGETCLAHVREFVDEIVTVTDEEIAEALLLMAERAKMVVEPAGAAGVAAAMFRKVDLKFPAVIVLSGGNIDPLLLLRVIRFGMSSSGRYFAFKTYLTDRPGELHRLIGVIAETGANIVGVEHHREGIALRLGDVEVGIQVETRGREHMGSLKQRLTDAGYAVEGY